MGLWDVFDNAVKKLVTKAYQCTYDLGRVAVSKTIDGAVEIPTVTKSVLASSYALGSAAVSKIDESVRNDGVKQKVKEYLPGPESRDKIVQVFTHPATKEALKIVAPGGAQAAYNIVGSVLLGNYQNPNQNQNQNQNDIDEQNKYEHVIKQLKVLQTENEKMHNQLNKLVMTTTNNSSSSPSSSIVSEQKPEDVITEFMTKGLKVKGLDNHRVVVPSTMRSKI